MTDQDLEEHLQTLHRLYAHEQEDANGRQITPQERGYLRQPASRESIDACENFLGRKFSPSYKHFLSLHDGWEGYADLNLLGTYDYQREDVQKDLADRMKAFIIGSGGPGEALPLEIFFLQNLYRLVDAVEPVPDELSDLKNYLTNFKETDNVDNISQEAGWLLPNDWLCLPKHTIIGCGYNDNLLILNNNNRSQNGELRVEEYAHGSIDQKAHSFYDYVLTEIDQYRVR